MPRGRPARCPYCGGRSINKGFRLTKTMGKRRLKQCKVCRRKFTPKNQPLLETQAKEAAPIQSPEEKVDNNEAPAAGVVAEPSETPEPNNAAVEPADDSKPLLNALNEEWTS